MRQSLLTAIASVIAGRMLAICYMTRGAAMSFILAPGVVHLVTSFWLCGFVGLPLFVVAGLGWTLWDNWQSRQVARNLAGALGLEPLHNAPNLMQQWFGGWLHGRAWAIKPVVFLARSYDGAHHRSSFRATFYLRAILAVNVSEPLNVVAERTHNEHNAATSLSDAFPMLEHGERLPRRAQDALLHFVQHGN
ncbi:MAG: hypothetical protein EOM24_28565, partial [Chloroflexia bacterium]|nr:hypothetical protein [Chloroflexia bacterium]